MPSKGMFASRTFAGRTFGSRTWGPHLTVIPFAGPYTVAAAQCFAAGAQAIGSYSAGAVAVDAFAAGSVAQQGLPE